MFLNDKHHPGLKKKNKSPENLRQIDFNNFFKTKNPILDAYAQNIIFGHKIKYLSNHKNKQSNSQSKTKRHIHNNTTKNFKLNPKSNEIKQINNSFKDLNININTQININSPLPIPQLQNYINNNNNNNININNTNISNNNNINIINNNINNNIRNVTTPEIISINTLFNNQDIPITLSNLNIDYSNFERPKTSLKPIGNIRAYAANTYQGIIRNYNEDRVSITLNIPKPSNYNKTWPRCSLFGIYDGHGGNKCADFLKDNLHSFIIKDINFPQNPKKALINGFQKAEDYFINNYALNKDNPNEINDKSGSCAIIALIIENICYIANVGDSRALISLNKGKDIIVLSKDHKPNEENEYKRIILNGGKIYQTQTTTNKSNYNQILIGPYRVFPGRLSVSRTIGDVEAKLPKFGGKENVIISNPEINYFYIDDEIDFLILGCDGIFDQLNNEEVAKCVWLTCDLNNIKNYYDIQNINDQCSCAVDMIMKSSLMRKTLDNITVVLICFKNFEREINRRLNMENKDYLYSYNCVFTEPDEKIYNELNHKFDIEQLEEYGKENKKKNTPPTSSKHILKNNNNISNFKKGSVVKKKFIKKSNNGKLLPHSPKMKAVLKQNFFDFLKK